MGPPTHPQISIEWRMVRLASFLADSARPTYERIAAYLAGRLDGPVEFLAGVPWEERHRRLDAGEIDLAFMCGLPYTRSTIARTGRSSSCARR
jgi:hypothetical protein